MITQHRGALLPAKQHRGIPAVTAPAATKQAGSLHALTQAPLQQDTFQRQHRPVQFGANPASSNPPVPNTPENQPVNPATSTPSATGTPTTSPIHYVNDVAYKTPDGTYQMVVEIPAGTNEKWQTDAVTGQFYHDTENGVPRIINFLPYPMNYGIVPQTLLSREKGGDGDPTDIITLAPALPRGWAGPVKIIGALKLSERGETDTKIVAILPNGPFKDINDLPELLMKHPGAVEIVKNWFEGYKGPGTFLFEGYANREEAMEIIEASHQDWQEDMARQQNQR